MSYNYETIIYFMQNFAHFSSLILILLVVLFFVFFTLSADSRYTWLLLISCVNSQHKISKHRSEHMAWWMKAQGKQLRPEVVDQYNGCPASDCCAPAFTAQCSEIMGDNDLAVEQVLPPLPCGGPPPVTIFTAVFSLTSALNKLKSNHNKFCSSLEYTLVHCEK